MNLSFYIYFVPGLLYIFDLELTVLQNKICSGAAMITNNKVRFSADFLSSPIRLTGNLHFHCSLFTLINVYCWMGIFNAGLL